MKINQPSSWMEHKKLQGSDPGAKWDEGKPFFQEYIEAKFGWDKVMCGMDIIMKKRKYFPHNKKQTIHDNRYIHFQHW